MNAFVLDQTAELRKCFVAYVTNVWSVTGMNTFVLPEAAELSK